MQELVWFSSPLSTERQIYFLLLYFFFNWSSLAVGTLRPPLAQSDAGGTPYMRLEGFTLHKLMVGLIYLLGMCRLWEPHSTPTQYFGVLMFVALCAQKLGTVCLFETKNCPEISKSYFSGNGFLVSHKKRPYRYTKKKVSTRYRGNICSWERECKSCGQSKVKLAVVGHDNKWGMLRICLLSTNNTP